MGKLGRHVHPHFVRNRYMGVNDEDIKSIQERLEAAEAAIDEGKKERKQMAVDYSRLAYKAEKDARRLRQIDEGRKRKNIIIEGVPERAGETPRKVALDLMVDIGAATAGERIGIDSAYRIGRYRADAKKSRNIMIRFKDMETKIKLFQQVAKMKNIIRWKDVYVSDDLTPEQQDERKDLRCLTAIARQQGMPAKLKGNKIEIGEKSFLYKDIDRLPQEST